MQLGGVEFRVMEAWKGVSARSAVVYGQGESYYGTIQEGDVVVENSCHYASFARGKSYLIYASRSAGYLNASVCSGTKSLANAEEDLLALGPPAVRLPEAGGPIFSPDSIATVVTVSAALALASALIVRRRRRGEPS